jgi:Zn-dependent protease
MTLEIKIAVFAAFVFCIVVHEVAHAVVALWCGDSTARDLGRITLNPIPHIDPFMSILLPGLLLISGLPPFGGAKPVPVNMLNLRHPFRDMMYVALAGPISNILLAILFALAMNVLPWVVESRPLFAENLARFLVSTIVLNLVLAIFNMVPIPPLDGSRVLAYLLPREQGAWIYDYRAQTFGMFFIMVLVMVDGLTFLGPAIQWTLGLLAETLWTDSTVFALIRVGIIR